VPQSPIAGDAMDSRSSSAFNFTAYYLLDLIIRINVVSLLFAHVDVVAFTPPAGADSDALWRTAPEILRQ